MHALWACAKCYERKANANTFVYCGSSLEYAIDLLLAAHCVGGMILYLGTQIMSFALFINVRQDIHGYNVFCN